MLCSDPLGVFIIVFSIFLASSAVRELSLAVNSSHLTVTWDAPLMPNGVIMLYSVMLSGINLVDSQSIEIANSSMNVSETMYTVAHSSLPYSNYTAVVVAFTGAGPGPKEEDTVQTAEEGQLHLLYILEFPKLL